MAVVFVLVLISWIFFRADTVSDAVYIITHLSLEIPQNISPLDMGAGVPGILFSFFLIAFLLFAERLLESGGLWWRIHKKVGWVGWPVYITLIIFMLLFGVFMKTPFIYFQF
jgi:hypothetical protein